MTRNKEFGDFQTPRDLAISACRAVHGLGFRPATILEPTCGVGAFAVAAAEVFDSATFVLGADINPAYVGLAATTARTTTSNAKFDFFAADVFTENWKDRLANGLGPLLICGNPPWVTISELGVLDSINAPARRAEAGLSGFDAMTGKSNFDVCEWIDRKSVV